MNYLANQAIPLDQRTKIADLALAHANELMALTMAHRFDSESVPEHLNLTREAFTRLAAATVAFTLEESTS